jgi:hypothetical protein
MAYPLEFIGGSEIGVFFIHGYLASSQGLNNIFNLCEKNNISIYLSSYSSPDEKTKILNDIEVKSEDLGKLSFDEIVSNCLLQYNDWVKRTPHITKRIIHGHSLGGIIVLPLSFIIDLTNVKILLLAPSFQVNHLSSCMIQSTCTLVSKLPYSYIYLPPYLQTLKGNKITDDPALIEMYDNRWNKLGWSVNITTDVTTYNNTNKFPQWLDNLKKKTSKLTIWYNELDSLVDIPPWLPREDYTIQPGWIHEQFNSLHGKEDFYTKYLTYLNE